MRMQKAPRHGGDLALAIKVHGGDPRDWLDLSAGISPWAYPLSVIDKELWRQLPEHPQKLIEAARTYYQCGNCNIAPTPGSQLTIGLLPTLIKKPQCIAIPEIGYQEHAYAWQNAGHKVVRFRTLSDLQQLTKLNQVSCVVVINPNNPTGEIVKAGALLAIAENLEGVMIVDEAFADLVGTQSLCHHKMPDNIIVLRSIGKFFGLAGARVGFVIGNHRLVERLEQLLSSWSINAAAQAIATQALEDGDWQRQQRIRIEQQAFDMQRLFSKAMDDQFTKQCFGLFNTLTAKSVLISKLHNYLAEQQIWTRLGDLYKNQNEPQGAAQNWLRVSLPGAAFDRLQLSLSDHQFLVDE